MTATGMTPKRKGELRARVEAVKVGETITVLDPVELSQLQAGGRHYGIVFKKKADTLTRIK
jgi:hypothetical protein